ISDMLVRRGRRGFALFVGFSDDRRLAIIVGFGIAVFVLGIIVVVKAVRAQSMRGRMAMLGLYVRQGAPWLADLRAELLSFPAGRHDDQVDALGLVGQLLD